MLFLSETAGILHTNFNYNLSVLLFQLQRRSRRTFWCNAQTKCTNWLVQFRLDVFFGFPPKLQKGTFLFFFREGLDFVLAHLCGRVSRCQFQFLVFPLQDERFRVQAL